MDMFAFAQKKGVGGGEPNARISVYENFTTEEPMLKSITKRIFYQE